MASGTSPAVDVFPREKLPGSYACKDTMPKDKLQPKVLSYCNYTALWLYNNKTVPLVQEISHFCSGNSFISNTNDGLP